MLIFDICIPLWTATWENIPFDMCAQSDQSLCCPNGKHFASLAIQNAHGEDSDQTARMRRLIWIFAGRTYPQVRFLTSRLFADVTISTYRNVQIVISVCTVWSGKWSFAHIVIELLQIPHESREKGRHRQNRTYVRLYPSPSGSQKYALLRAVSYVFV